MSRDECPGCGAYPGTFAPGAGGLCEGCEMEIAREATGTEPDDAHPSWLTDDEAAYLAETDPDMWGDDLEDDEYRCPQCGECCDSGDVLAYGMCGACFDAVLEADAEATMRAKAGEP